MRESVYIKNLRNFISTWSNCSYRVIYLFIFFFINISYSSFNCCWNWIKICHVPSKYSQLRISLVCVVIFWLCTRWDVDPSQERVSFELEETISSIFNKSIGRLCIFVNVSVGVGVCIWLSFFLRCTTQSYLFCGVQMTVWRLHRCSLSCTIFFENDQDIVFLSLCLPFAKSCRWHVTKPCKGDPFVPYTADPG